MRRIIALTSLNYFISGALTLLIPLLLLERKVNVADIGIVLSVLPLVFMTARLAFAAVADRVGWSAVFLLLNWPATLISVIIYVTANSISGFSLGKIIEGIKESAYWAVNRTAIFALSPRQEEREATRINAVIWTSTAAGSAAAGIGIAFLGFSSTLLILVATSAILVIPSLLLWKPKETATNHGKSQSKLTSLSNPRGRSKQFWLISLALMLNGLATYPIITLLLPVFMDQQLGYSYLSIGMAFMLYNVVSAIVTLLTLRTPLDSKRAIIQSILGVIATVALANAGFLFMALFTVLAVVRGLGIGYFESMIVKATRNRNTVSVDIGFLHVPMRLAEFASVLSAGFIAQEVGYSPVFIASGVFFAAFSIMSYYIVNADKFAKNDLEIQTLANKTY
jgi:MFS family permease